MFQGIWAAETSARQNEDLEGSNNSPVATAMILEGQGQRSKIWDHQLHLI